MKKTVLYLMMFLFAYMGLTFQSIFTAAKSSSARKAESDRGKQSEDGDRHTKRRLNPEAEEKIEGKPEEKPGKPEDKPREKPEEKQEGKQEKPEEKSGKIGEKKDKPKEEIKNPDELLKKTIMDIREAGKNKRIDKETLETIKKAVEAGADVNAKIENTNSLINVLQSLHAKEDHPDDEIIEKIVEFLLEKGANAVEYDPLSLAAEKGNLKIVRMLIAKRAVVNPPDEDRSTPLMHAAENLNIEVINELLKNGANANAKNADDQTALTMASKSLNNLNQTSNAFEAVELLLKNGANPNEGYEDSDSWLHFFMEEFRKQVEDDNKQNPINTPFHNRVRRVIEPTFLEMIKMLLNNGANPSAKFLEIIEKPAFWKFKKVYSDFLKKTEEIKGKGKSKGKDDEYIFKLEDQDRRLLNGINNFNLYQINKAIASGADVNVINIFGSSALMTALALLARKPQAAEPLEQIIKILLENNADVNIENRLGRLPLHSATLIGNDRVVKQLLDKTKDERRKDVFGLNPVAYANIHGHKQIAEIFKKRRGF